MAWPTRLDATVAPSGCCLAQVLKVASSKVSPLYRYIEVARLSNELRCVSFQVFELSLCLSLATTYRIQNESLDKMPFSAIMGASTLKSSCQKSITPMRCFCAFNVATEVVRWD